MVWTCLCVAYMYASLCRRFKDYMLSARFELWNNYAWYPHWSERRNVHAVSGIGFPIKSPIKSLEVRTSSSCVWLKFKPLCPSCEPAGGRAMATRHTGQEGASISGHHCARGDDTVRGRYPRTWQGIAARRRLVRQHVHPLRCSLLVSAARRRCCMRGSAGRVSNSVHSIDPLSGCS